MIPNQKILLILLSTFLMVGCAKNEISIYNLGSKEWHNINISAGGRSFEVEKLNEGASHTLRFNSKSEGGGEINAELDGTCLLYTSPSPRDLSTSRMPSSA